MYNSLFKLIYVAENGKHTGKILIDLQKTSKSFSDKSIKCFQSYLRNRASFVSLGTVFSEAGTINYGVPQGSILEPLLFLQYKNHITQVLSNTHMYLYVDGTSIFCKYDLKTLRKSSVLNKEFAKYTIGLLIINHHLSLVTIIQMCSFQ